MKKITLFHSTLFLSLTFSTEALAKLPKSELFPSFSEKEESTLHYTVQSLFEYRNAKGELIFSSRQQSSNDPLWTHLDPLNDQVEGTATAKAYANPKLPQTSKEVIVAVIDSGVDIQHEDLKGKIWVNFAEKNGLAGVDDDGNGYVDDLYGWNFLGAKDGNNIDATTLEVTREYARLKKKSSRQRLSTNELAYFEKVKKQYEEELSQTQSDLRYYQELMSAIELLKKMGLKEETVEAVEQISSNDPEINNAKRLAILVFSNNRQGSSQRLKLMIQDTLEKINYCYNPEFNPSLIIGDNPEKMDEIGYGNNNVTGPDATHGTHVAGIIAANRDNNLGILGQADQVKIMSLRAVPNGDERDKDVANAIFYAVKNGAKVINMSFGKQYSPNKRYVDQAVAYAEEHGVILVHAAGNDGKSTEMGHQNFPSKKIKKLGGRIETEASNWIEVGASSKLKITKLAANFSNYGKSSVDLFAPGVGIYSTTPGNLYQTLNGTSMATPEVAGIVALLISRFPLYETSEIRNAVLKNTTQYPNLVVNIPGSNGMSQISFSELSRSGGIVNTNLALEALVKSGNP
jgi:cell wall-associated protease